MTYGTHETSTTLIDHEHLEYLRHRVADASGKVALVGFNETTKHLLNWFPDKITHVFDPNVEKQGIRWRGVTVEPIGRVDDISEILISDHKYLYDVQGQIDRLYERGMPIGYAPRNNYKPSEFIDVRSQQSFYKDILSNRENAPPSMMADEKIMFLVELLRAALQVEGDVVEMGVYQAGSSWYIAKTLQALGQSRDLLLFDVFETHMMHPNATMCNDEIARWMSFYDKTVMIEGLLHDPEILAHLDGRKICFGHYDVGWENSAVPALWRAITPGGILLLDNYGHLSGQTWRFDQFFAEQGEVVIRFPWSEQGLVLKRAANAR